MFGLRTIIIAIVAIVVFSMAATAFYAYRESIWREGRDAALNAVAKQNEVAREAAKGVRTNIDQCFENGGDWNVATATCDRD